MAGFLEGLGNFFTGKPGGFKRLEGVPSDAFSSAANYYKGLLGNDSQDFDAFAAPELRRFNQQIIPDIAEQFAGAGSGAINGSGFRNAAVNASTDLSERLGAIRAQLRQSAAQGLTDIGREGTYYQQGQPGLVDAAGPILGTIGSIYGGPAGGAIGSGAGNWLSNRFSSKNQEPNQGGNVAQGQYGPYPTQGNYDKYTDEMKTFR